MSNLQEIDNQIVEAEAQIRMLDATDKLRQLKEEISKRTALEIPENASIFTKIKISIKRFLTDANTGLLKNGTKVIFIGGLITSVGALLTGHLNETQTAIWNFITLSIYHAGNYIDNNYPSIINDISDTPISPVQPAGQGEDDIIPAEDNSVNDVPTDTSIDEDTA